MIAILMDKYHLHFDKVARMTDRQIYEICFHRRKNGEIELPDPIEEDDGKAPTLEEQLAVLNNMATMFRMSPEAVQQAKEKIKARAGIN